MSIDTIRTVDRQLVELTLHSCDVDEGLVESLVTGGRSEILQHVDEVMAEESETTHLARTAIQSILRPRF